MEMTHQIQVHPGPKGSCEIIGKLAAIIGECGAVGKNARNEHQRYNFQTVDDIPPILGPLLAKHGVVILPWQECSTDEVNGRVRHTKAAFQFTIATTDGSYVLCQIEAEANDHQDKGLPKCQSMAFKYMAKIAFCLRIRDNMDVEHENIENATAPAPKPRSKRAPPPSADEIKEAAAADVMATIHEADSIKELKEIGETVGKMIEGGKIPKAYEGQLQKAWQEKARSLKG